MTDSFDPNNQEHQKLKVRYAWSKKKLFFFFLGGGCGVLKFYQESHLRELYFVSVTEVYWNRQKLRLVMAFLTSGWPENALKLWSKLVLRWVLVTILFSETFLVICTSDNPFIYSAKGHMGERSCSGFTCPLVLAFRY